MTGNLWHKITHVVPTWEMFRDFMAVDLNIFVCYHESKSVIIHKPLLDYGECLMCLATEQERCNECFKWQNRYTGVCWFVSTDSVGHVTLMIQFRTLITNAKDIKLYTRCATFFRLAFVVIFDDCFYNENDISWHGNTHLHGLLSWIAISYAFLNRIYPFVQGI